MSSPNLTLTPGPTPTPPNSSLSLTPHPPPILTPAATPPSALTPAGATPAAEFRTLHWDAVPPRLLASAGETVWSGPTVDEQSLIPMEKLDLFVKAHVAGHANVKLASMPDGKQRLLDTNASNNILIKFKDTTASALAAALHSMDTRALTYTVVLQCQGVLAKTQAFQAVQQWLQTPGAQPGNLGPAETFVHVLGSVPDVKLRLDVLKLHHYMLEDFPKKLADATRVLQASEGLYQSVSWRRLLHQLLLVGNAINNQRPARGPASSRTAPAFKLSSLPKFADMRSKCGLDLLDVVVEALELDCPRHVDELMALEGRLASAKEVDLRLLTSEVQDLERALGRARRFVEGLEQQQQHEQQQGQPEGQKEGSKQQQQEARERERLLRQWGRSLEQWKTQVSDLQHCYSAAVASVRDAATWHCEPVVGAGWELSNAKPFFENLHKFLLQVRDSSRKVRALMDKLERQQQQQQEQGQQRQQHTPKGSTPGSPSVALSSRPSLPFGPASLSPCPSPIHDPSRSSSSSRLALSSALAPIGSAPPETGCVPATNLLSPPLVTSLSSTPSSTSIASTPLPPNLPSGAVQSVHSVLGSGHQSAQSVHSVLGLPHGHCGASQQPGGGDGNPPPSDGPPSAAFFTPCGGSTSGTPLAVHGTVATACIASAAFLTPLPTAREGREGMPSPCVGLRIALEAAAAEGVGVAGTADEGRDAPSLRRQREALSSECGGVLGSQSSSSSSSSSGGGGPPDRRVPSGTSAVADGASWGTNTPAEPRGVSEAETEDALLGADASEPTLLATPAASDAESPDISPTLPTPPMAATWNTPGGGGGVTPRCGGAAASSSRPVTPAACCALSSPGGVVRRLLSPAAAAAGEGHRQGGDDTAACPTAAGDVTAAAGATAAAMTGMAAGAAAACAREPPESPDQEALLPGQVPCHSALVSELGPLPDSVQWVDYEGGTSGRLLEGLRGELRRLQHGARGQGHCWESTAVVLDMQHLSLLSALQLRALHDAVAACRSHDDATPSRSQQVWGSGGGDEEEDAIAGAAARGDPDAVEACSRTAGGEEEAPAGSGPSSSLGVGGPWVLFASRHPHRVAAERAERLCALGAPQPDVLVTSSGTKIWAAADRAAQGQDGAPTRSFRRGADVGDGAALQGHSGSSCGGSAEGGTWVAGGQGACRQPLSLQPLLPLCQREHEQAWEQHRRRWVACEDWDQRVGGKQVDVTKQFRPPEFNDLVQGSIRAASRAMMLESTGCQTSTPGSTADGDEAVIEACVRGDEVTQGEGSDATSCGLQGACVVGRVECGSETGSMWQVAVRVRGVAAARGFARALAAELAAGGGPAVRVFCSRQGPEVGPQTGACGVPVVTAHEEAAVASEEPCTPTPAHAAARVTVDVDPSAVGHSGGGAVISTSSRRGRKKRARSRRAGEAAFAAAAAAGDQPCSGGKAAHGAAVVPAAWMQQEEAECVADEVADDVAAQPDAALCFVHLGLAHGSVGGLVPKVEALQSPLLRSVCVAAAEETAAPPSLLTAGERLAACTPPQQGCQAHTAAVASLPAAGRAGADCMSAASGWPDDEDVWVVDCVPSTGTPARAVQYALEFVLGVPRGEAHVVSGALPGLLSS